MSERFVRHTKMAAWGIGVVLEERGGQLTVLFEDGNRRSFKVAHAANLLADTEPESEQQRELLRRGRATGDLGKVAVNLELEAQLRHGFEDPAPFLVYADWLLQRDDPRGALIQAQHRKKVTLERSLLKTHAAALIPPGFTGRGDYDLEWKLGFLATVRIGKFGDDDLLEELLAHPSASLLDKLTLDGDDYRGAPIGVIAEHGKQLRRLVVGGDTAIRRWATGDIAGLFSLPRLVELDVTGARVLLRRAIASTTLERLSVTSSRVDPETERHLMTLAAPALTQLSFACDQSHPPPAGALAQLPALRSLSLRGTLQTGQWIDRILAAPCAKQLESLDFRGGDLDDAGARALMARRDRLPALAMLDLSNNRVSPDVAVELERLAPTVRAHGMRPQAPALERNEPYISDEARLIAQQPRRWETIGVDPTHDRVWGRYLGTVGTYDVAIERDTSWAACSCPSSEEPCKHAQALYVMSAAGTIPEARPPSDHYDRAGRKRYRSGHE